MPRLKLTLAYDGRLWNGWQSRVAGETVQDQLEAVLRDPTSVPVRVHGSGRTDAGAHDCGQVAAVAI